MDDFQIFDFNSYLLLYGAVFLLVSEWDEELKPLYYYFYAFDESKSTLNELCFKCEIE